MWVAGVEPKVSPQGARANSKFAGVRYARPQPPDTKVRLTHNANLRPVIVIVSLQITNCVGGRDELQNCVKSL